MKEKKINQENPRKILRVYTPPEVIVFGDAKEITLNASQEGTGDNFLEGPCSSPGNCS